MKIAVRIISFAIAVAVVLFALANRGPVTLSFAPLPVERTLPVYLVILVAFAAGVAVGGFSHWIATGRRRRAAKDERRQLVRVERELTEVRQHGPSADADLPTWTSMTTRSDGVLDGSLGDAVDPGVHYLP